MKKNIIEGCIRCNFFLSDFEINNEGVERENINFIWIFK